MTKMILRLLKSIFKNGNFTIIDSSGKAHAYGDGTGEEIVIKIHNNSFYRKLISGPLMALGEGYMYEHFTIEKGDIKKLLELALLNQDNVRNFPTMRFIAVISRYRKLLLPHNLISASTKNVAHHYDISNEFFALFLDQDMQYSCAYFKDGNDNLEQAQIDKKDHIIKKLLLKPGMKVIDVGCGWGGMAISIAKAADVEVIGITLSKEQAALANQRAKDEGLQDRVKFIQQDYRETEGKFDRVVSVGIIEHVGLSNYDKYYSKLNDLLTDDGVALIHCIGAKKSLKAKNPWVEKYIFPGGYIPSLSEILPVIEQNKFWITDTEILRIHYAETLKHWMLRCEENKDKIIAMYDETFYRMWKFYLVGCEMGFRHDALMVMQTQLAKKIDTVPITRDYLYS